jgi:hypothetical protein
VPCFRPPHINISAGWNQMIKSAARGSTRPSIRVRRYTPTTTLSWNSILRFACCPSRKLFWPMQNTPETTSCARVVFQQPSEPDTMRIDGAGRSTQRPLFLLSPRQMQSRAMFIYTHVYNYHRRDLAASPVPRVCAPFVLYCISIIPGAQETRYAPLAL